MTDDISLVSLLQPNITFVMIKQDAIRNGVMPDIIERIEDEGFRIIHQYHETIPTIPHSLIEEFYREHIGRVYYPALFASIALGARPMIVEYPKYDMHAWKKMRSLIGATDSRKAKPDTIRGKFGGHLFDSDAPMASNAIHASDSLASVIKEINIMFSDLSELETTNHHYFKLRNFSDALLPATAVHGT